MGVLENDVDDIKKRLEEKNWSPVTRKNESSVEDELYTFLHHEFPKYNFQKQRVKGGGRGDIYVRMDAEVMIEIKLNLDDRTEYLRLVGQLYDYDIVNKYEVLLVIVGKCEPSLLKLAKGAVKFFNDISDSKKARFIFIE